MGVVIYFPRILISANRINQVVKDNKAPAKKLRRVGLGIQSHPGNPFQSA